MVIYFFIYLPIICLIIRRSKKRKSYTSLLVFKMAVWKKPNNLDYNYCYAKICKVKDKVDNSKVSSQTVINWTN
ncbi:MAG: hypothetical protein D4R68_08210 [Ignavibacteriales bacterium]|nr:MAG: hypothetical protein D4R68_08210 [Ignavibacteriales bacterium]